MIDFEWNREKEKQNITKHGFNFTEASEVFGDDSSLTVFDPDHSFNEDRYLIFGKSGHKNHLVVSFTDRNSKIRIISARRMTPTERKAYETQKR